MNYRHIYHAGNFADVLKHVVLTRLMIYMQKKEAAFRILDTHAGIGLYDLTSEQAQKTGEWQDGIGRLINAEIDGAAAALLEPYLAAIRALNEGGALTAYPGSPKLARLLMRRQDRLSAIELHPEDAARLSALFAGDHQVRVTALDGWLALKSYLPPKERRGIVLVDPPFEETGEFERLAEGLVQALGRFSGGVYCLWYPVKDRLAVRRFHARLCALRIPRAMAVELAVRRQDAAGGLAATGLVVVTPPWTLADALAVLMPELKRLLGQDSAASWQLTRLTDEAGEPLTALGA
ncbi:MAG: 23S rRNA (adenine(2030)-N(6))-methyltransferase RlmJ [Pararhizobium sp.]